MLVVKTNLNGDLRRFTLNNHEQRLLTVKKILAKLYKIPITSFKISYSDEDGDTVTLSSNAELSEAVEEVRRTGQPALRLIVTLTEDPVTSNEEEECDTPQTTPQETAPPTPSTPSREDKSMDKLQSAEFRQQVEQLILKTVTSKPFIDSIVDAILPTLLDSMRKNDTNNTVCSEQTTLPSTTPDSVEAETSSSSVANELINFLEPQEPAESDSVPSDEDSGEKKEEEASEQNSSEVEPVVQGEDAADAVNSDQEPSLVRSIISFFKGKKVHRQHPAEPVVEEPVPEEVLQRLNDMGFHDREANIQAFRFHKQFNEGLDEIVEDLLTQSLMTSSNLSNDKVMTPGHDDAAPVVDPVQSN